MPCCSFQRRSLCSYTCTVCLAHCHAAAACVTGFSVRTPAPRLPVLHALLLWQRPHSWSCPGYAMAVLASFSGWPSSVGI